jgi:hypothetical protein
VSSNSGILENLMPSVPITTTLTLYPISFGWKTKNSSLLLGACQKLLDKVQPIKYYMLISGDGTLSVIDVRSTKKEPFAHSEDQEDELLSIIPIKGYVHQPNLRIVDLYFL